MCGIAGLWSSPRRPASAIERMVIAMTDTLARRGPDSFGHWIGEQDGVGLGHRRLSIVDLSPAGHQPMTSASQRFTISFNGEVYNFAELRRELGSRPWRGNSDTEVMLEAIDAWGLEEAVSRFVGMFAFALWDAQTHRLHLVRDRLGIKPLYFAQAGTCLVFGSELKALLTHPDFRRDVDLSAVAAYFRFGYVPGSSCIFRATRKVAPGTILTFDAPDISRVATHTYWSAAAVAHNAVPFAGTLDEASQELERLLKQAVGLRMVADVPLGAFLSGGIDSSVVVALMQSSSSRQIKTFSIGNEGRDYDESQDAARVARHLGTDHTTLTVSADSALAVVPELSRMYDEPFADSSQIPTYLVAQLARAQVTVALSGDGGDELFAGYTRHLFAPLVFPMAQRIPATLRHATARGLEGLARVAARNQSSLRRWIRLPQQKLEKVARLLDADDDASMYRSLCSQWQDPRKLVRAAALEPAMTLEAIKPDLVSNLMLSDQLGYLPDDILTKVDRATMYASLEARVPLLDHRVVEFSWRLPPGLNRRMFVGKLPLRRILERYVPRTLTERPKMGFGIPIGQWLRGPLRAWGDSLLSHESIGSAGLLDFEQISQIWQRHQASRSDESARLWTLLMFQSWQDWLKQQPAVPWVD